MTMATDQLVVLLVVAMAAGFLARRVVRSVRAARDTAAGCASDCGCAAAGEEKARRL